ncbi:MAG: alpha/beta hydrolase [Sutterellaceae bacterium]|nr:alpha/beta hydrolase [Burkholderiaceae bacterium]MDW8430689.1 alpha/beta hydrolase [Sutterellaceae bacterium]
MIVTGQYADLAGGIRLHYATAGTRGRPLVLCLHGFPEYWAAWDDVLPELGSWAFAVAPDLRGFNLSSQPLAVEAYRTREIVGDLVGLIDALGYERAFVLAHDWGGAAAWQLAIAQPQRVQKLAIVNSPHPLPFARALASNAQQQQASAYMNWLRQPDAERRLAENGFARLLGFFADEDGRLPAWLTPERIAAYRQVWARGLTGGLNYYRATPLHPPTADTPGAAALQLDARALRVGVPTLVIWGLRDRALLPCLLEGLEEVVASLRLLTVPEATHWIAHERPQWLAAEVTAFFRE